MRDLTPYIAPPGWKLEDYDRSSGVGASEAGKAMGMLPTTWERATPMDLADEKTGRAPPFTGNQRTYWGGKIEPAIADWHAETTGATLHKLKTIVHPEHPYIFGTPDRWMSAGPDGDGLLQIKCTRFKSKEWGTPGTDQVPNYVAAQCATEMAVTERSWVQVAVLVGGSEPLLYIVRRDPSFEADVLSGLRRFWFELVLPRRAA